MKKEQIIRLISWVHNRGLEISAVIQLVDMTKFPKHIVGWPVILKEMTKPHLFTFVQHFGDLTIHWRPLSARYSVRYTVTTRMHMESSRMEWFCSLIKSMWGINRTLDIGNHPEWLRSLWKNALGAILWSVLWMYWIQLISACQKDCLKSLWGLLGCLDLKTLPIELVSWTEITLSGYGKALVY